MAEGLQVFLIKEKDRIATVWLDVIDIRCKCEAPLLHALLAERVLRNKAITKLLPSIAIPPFCRRTLKSGPTRLSSFTSCSGMLFSIAFMLSTKINTTRYRAPTTGVFAKRHERHYMEGIKDLAKTQIAKSPHSISIEPGLLLLSLGAKRPLLQSKSFASETVYKF
nr:hypothetical protein [Sutterella wadsworthensis]